MKTILVVFAILVSAPCLPAQTREPIKPAANPPLAASGTTASSPETAAANAVTVLDFTTENLAGKDWEVGLADFVELALQQEGVSTLERRQIRLILDERDLQSRLTPTPEAWQMAKLPAVAYFVGGTISRTAPDHFALTLSVIQAGTATVKASFTQRGAYPADWLPAIQSLAREVRAQVRTPAPSQPIHSGAESLTWLPEAALSFFRGLEFYSRGDYPRAIPCFRDAAGKAGRFDQARLWEARACRQAGFQELAEFAARPVLRPPVAATNLASKLPVVAVVASDDIPAAARGAFVQRLRQSGKFTLFDPASIAATTREIDLQLTGQMAAPLNGGNVWLVVDSTLVLSASGGTLQARQVNLLSGEPIRQARLSISGAPSERACDRLAEAFLQSRPPPTPPPPTLPGVSPQELLAPDARDGPESAFAKTLCLAKAFTNNARYWVALADCYTEWDSKMWLLDQAVHAVERDKTQPDAPFWLASALWRKRHLSSWAWFYSHAWQYSDHPLTNDFAQLLHWFPKSPEAVTVLAEVARKSGIATYSDPKDGRFMAPVFTNAPSEHNTLALPTDPPAAPRVTDAQSLTRLNDFLRVGDNAKAWLVADSLLETRDPAIRAEARHAHDQLWERLLEEDRQIKAFNAAFDNHQTEAAGQIGRALLHNIQRKPCLAVIEHCGQLILETGDVDAYCRFVCEQAENYKEDFDFDPVTGNPATVILDFTLEGNPLRAERWTTPGPDMEYACLMGELAEKMQAEHRPDLAAGIFDAIRRDNALPLRNRLTAAYDLAWSEYRQGKAFEALELLKELLQQTKGADIPIARKTTWGSGQVEGMSFDLLRKIRLYTDEDTDFTRCCGEPAPVPAPDPALAKAMNQLFDELWKNINGGVGGPQQNIRQSLFLQKDHVLPILLYKLWKGEDAKQMLIFCSELGTNAAEALPYLPRYVCYSDDFPERNNALYAFCGIGKPAACATPLLILAAEGTTSVFNAEAALRSVGPAPRRVMPYLARLLYHQNPGVCTRAANAIVRSANLDATRFSKQDLVASIRNWWTEEGSKEEWKD